MLDPNIAQLAEKLAAAMADAKVAKEFKLRQHEAQLDPDAQAVFKAFQDHWNVLARKEQEHKPIEVEDKHKLRELQERLYRNEKLKAQMAAEADYAEMIQQVKDILAKHLSAGEEEKK